MEEVFFPLVFPSPTADLVRDSSIFTLAKLMAGTIQAPQLHFIPCQAYFPTLVLHLGHSRRPFSLLCSSSGRIQDSGLMK